MLRCRFPIFCLPSSLSKTPPAAFLLLIAKFVSAHKWKTKGSGGETETKCNFKAVEGGWHKTQQLRGCAHDWCPWGDDECIQTEATQRSLIKTERTHTHTHSILNANAINCGCVCAGKLMWLQVISGGVSGVGERMPPVFLLSSEHVALITHWLTSNTALQSAALTGSPSHVDCHVAVKALSLF